VALGLQLANDDTQSDTDLLLLGFCYVAQKLHIWHTLLQNLATNHAVEF